MSWTLLTNSHTSLCYAYRLQVKTSGKGCRGHGKAFVDSGKGEELDLVFGQSEAIVQDAMAWALHKACVTLGCD